MNRSDPLANDLRPATAAQQIAEVIRERILSGELVAGTALTEARLVKAFNVSRHTIREVLHILASQGIVTQHSYRGTTVTRLTVEDVLDIFRIRRLLELSAVEASSGARPEEFGLLEAAVDALDAASRARDWAALADADLGFHKALIAMHHSERVQRMYEQLQAELRLCLLVVDRTGQEEPESLVGEPYRHAMVAEHREILDLMRTGRRHEAKKQLRTALTVAEEYLTSVYLNEASVDAG